MPAAQCAFVDPAVAPGVEYVLIAGVDGFQGQGERPRTGAGKLIEQAGRVVLRGRQRMIVGDEQHVGTEQFIEQSGAGEPGTISAKGLRKNADVLVFAMRVDGSDLAFNLQSGVKLRLASSLA